MELSTQILIREALDRHIKVEVLDVFDNFIRLSKSARTEYIKQATRTSADVYIAPLIMENKYVTKKVLDEQGIRIPHGKLYTTNQVAIDDFDHYRESDIVIKPNNTNFGIGITMLKKNFSSHDFQTAINNAFNHDNSILVEEYISGKEYRFLVIGDKVSGILHRVPANVIGDGIHTIQELVDLKNMDPLRGKGYKTPLEKIRLDTYEKDYLLRQGKNEGIIPAKNEQVFLRENSNISTGGDSIDFTDAVHEKYKEIAVQAAHAVGAKICGADIIINNIQEPPNTSNYAVIELNFNPALHIHCFPYRGVNRHPEQAVLNLLGF